jgi:DNA-binding transcriptional ArsR family regulator
MNEETVLLSQPSATTKKSGHTLLNIDLIKKASKVLRAINHPLRQNLLTLIHESQTINVTDIYVKMRIEQSVASQHLAILRAAEAVKTKREGKQIYYTINYDGIQHVNSCVDKLVNK